MATFRSSHEATHALRVPPEAALARWADPDAQVRCHPEVARSERPAPGQLRLVLKEMKHGPSAFSGDYTLRFTIDGLTLRWSTLPGGSPQVEGEARFSPTPGGCTVRFRESATVQMELGALTARVLEPLVDAMMARGMRGFVDRMVAEIGA